MGKRGLWDIFSLSKNNNAENMKKLNSTANPAQFWWKWGGCVIQQVNPKRLPNT